MKLAGFVITAVVVGFSGPAFAQGASGANPPVNTNTSYDDNRNWLVSGFIGTNFSSSRDSSVDLLGIENLDSNNSTSFNWGGQLAYLGRGVIGGEFLADFSPGDGSFNNVLFQQSPSLNSYMFNVIGVAPFGHAHSFDPYVSGGIGWVTMGGDIFTVDPTRFPNVSTLQTESVSGSKFGWDIGFGGMAWSEKNWGFRGDVRYFKTGSNDTDVFDLNNINGDVFTRVELSGISFWKANAGLSFRW